MMDHRAEAQEKLEIVAATEPASGDDEARIVLAQAQVHAILALADQQRIANRLKVAELDLHAEAIYKKLDGYPLDFVIGPYLTTDDWASIEIPEDEHE